MTQGGKFSLLREFEREDLISSLVIYGLTPVQAQIYLTLLKLGTSTAKSVSVNSNTNRVDVYRALRRLGKLGLVEQVLGNPITFSPVEPGQALDILLEAKTSQVERLASNKAYLKRRLDTLSLDRPLEAEGGAKSQELFLKVLSGDRVFQRLKSLLMEAKTEVISVFSPKALILYDRIGIPELEKERHESGVAIRAVSTITKENYEQARAYSKIVNFHHSEKLRSHLRYTIVDRSYLLLPVGEPPASLSEATALWTNSNALIVGLIDDFEKLWLDSLPLEEPRVTKMRAVV
jgi:HTH-type transcriptional regulator, sugar sensing transcriptional regulator